MKIIQSLSHSPAFNLAAEEYLFSSVRDNVLFFYVNAPSVIMGAHQAFRNEVNEEYCTENNIQVLRRMSGGGAVYHDFGNLNYCFINNKKEGKSPLSGDFLLPIIHVLDTLSVKATIGQRKDVWLRQKYKISGTASCIRNMRELHHGTLLYDSNLVHLEKALTAAQQTEKQSKAIASVRSKVKNIRAELEEQGLENSTANVFFQKVIDAFLCYYGLNNTHSFSTFECEQIIKIETSKYGLDTWTHKK